MDDHQAIWDNFDAIGIEEVRKNLGARRYGEQKLKLALQWIEARESKALSLDSAKTLELAKEANDLARSANDAALESNSIARKAADSASRSAEAARNSNIIATAALIAAVIAIALTIIGLFLRK